jgi:two-component system sensor histidine kinase/response regulator
MTAHATMEERQRCLAEGMNDHISKPIDPAMLFETVGRFYKPAAAAVPAGGSTVSPGKGQELQPVAESQRTEVRTPVAEDLPFIEGLDTKDGMTRVAGNRKLYLKILRQFAEQQGPSVEQISAALAEGDNSLAERLAHTLKGVAGNIGAKPVQAVAGVLERLIRERAAAAEAGTAISAVAAALEPLLAEIRKALPSAEPAISAQASLPSVDPAQSRASAVELTKLLSEFDPGAVEFIEANQAVLRSLFPGDAWPQFEKHLQNYAFAEAQAQLEQALKSLPTI